MAEVDLLASYWSVSGAQPHSDREYSPYDFRERVEAIARAGFRGMGIWHADLERVQQKYTLAEMKRILDANGIVHVELEFLLDWFMDGEERVVSDHQRRLLLEAAEGLRARHIKIGDFFKRACPMPRLVESFAQLCDEGAQRGTRIVLELMPFSVIDTLEGALALVEGADAPNGGIIFDLWHVVKLGIPYDAVARVAPRFLLGVELNDGWLDWEPGHALAPADALHLETINHRQLCGEGEFDVRGFVAALQRAGYRGPWGIEVLSQALRERPLEEMVQRSFRSTRAQFAPG